MPENPILPPSPENPAETSTATAPDPVTIPVNYEPTPENRPADKVTIIEKIRRASASVFERHGVTFKRGRGRPRKDGSPSAADIPLQAPGVADAPLDPASPAAAAPVSVAAPVPVDSALLRRSIVSAIKGACGWAKSYCRKQATLAGIDEGFTARAIKEAEPEPEDFEQFSEALELVLQKYNAKTEYAPEIALGISTLKIGGGFFLLNKTFSAEIARRRALEKHPVQVSGAK